MNDDDDSDYTDNLPKSQKAKRAWLAIQTSLAANVTWRAGVLAHRAGATEIGPEHVLAALQWSWDRFHQNMQEDAGDDEQARLAWLDTIADPV